MQHDVLPRVLDRLTAIAAGPAMDLGHGLRAIPLTFRGGVPSGRRVLTDDDPSVELVWSEIRPARPRRITAGNVMSHDVVLSAGAVVVGGMADRAAATPRRIPAGTIVEIDVEPLGARWWDEGPLARRGRLTPLLTALVLHAAHADGAARHSAATCLWQVQAMEDEAQLDPAWGRWPSAAGWAITGHGVLLAAWVSSLRRARQLEWRRAAQAVIRPESDPVRVIADAVRNGDVTAQRALLGKGGDELILLRHDHRLVDVMLDALGPERGWSAAPPSILARRPR